MNEHQELFEDLIAELRAYASEKVEPEYDEDGDLILSHGYLDWANGARRDILRILERHEALTPRVVSTVEELDALPPGSVLLDIGVNGSLADSPVIACKTLHGDWSVMGSPRDRRWRSDEIVRDAEGSVIQVVHIPPVAALTIRREGDRAE